MEEEDNDYLLLKSNYANYQNKESYWNLIVKILMLKK